MPQSSKRGRAASIGAASAAAAAALAAAPAHASCPHVLSGVNVEVVRQ